MTNISRHHPDLAEFASPPKAKGREVMRFPNGRVALTIFVLWIGAGASVPGALVGARLTGRLDDGQLLRAVGAILVVAGLAAVAQAVTRDPKRHVPVTVTEPRPERPWLEGAA